MEINERKLKLTGIANLPKDLTNGKVYDLTIGNAEVRKVEEVPNDDNTIDRIFNIRISELSEVNIISDKGILTAKKKGSQSKLVHFKLCQLADKLDEDRVSYYNRRMSEYIDLLDEELTS